MSIHKTICTKQEKCNNVVTDLWRAAGEEKTPLWRAAGEEKTLLWRAAGKQPPYGVPQAKKTAYAVFF
ncbi:hypothetical protein, partial [Pantoea ananatis]